MRTHRSEQRKIATASGSDQTLLIETAEELARHATNTSKPLLLRPDMIGDDDPSFLYRGQEDAERILAEFSSDGVHNLAWLAEPFVPGRWYGVDTVSRNGRHVVAGAYEHRMDEVAGRLVLRHRISLGHGFEPPGLLDLAIGALDQTGIEHGAAHVEIVSSHDGLAVSDVLSAPRVPAVPADAAFAAFGYSHQHLLVEQVLRPDEFMRRLDWPARSSRCCLAVAPLRMGAGDTIEASDGLRVLRRLTGFHGLFRLAPLDARSLTAAVAATATATFVHPDRDSIENSLKVLHEMEDSGFLFGYGQPFFG